MFACAAVVCAMRLLQRNGTGGSDDQTVQRMLEPKKEGHGVSCVLSCRWDSTHVGCTRV